MRQETAPVRFVRLRVALAWTSLWLERVWNGIWPLQTLLLLMLAFGISGLLYSVGPWLHTILLVGSVAAMVFVLWRCRTAWRLPTRGEAMRRLERQSGVAHRPLEGLKDRPTAAADNGAEALWQAHRRQLAAHLAHLKPRLPKSDLGRRDRIASRGAGLLALAVAFAAAGSDALVHLRDALQPRFAVATATAPIVDLWIEPPEYTNKPPMFGTADGMALVAPAGSALVVRVNDAAAPVLTLREAVHPLEEEAAGQHALRLTPETDGRIAIRDGEQELAAWPLTLVPDEPPIADLPHPPSVTERQSARIDYLLRDDYGVVEAWIELRLANPDAFVGQHGKAMRLPLPLGDAALPEWQGVRFTDLTPHRWAGHDVIVRIAAKDAIGHTGWSEAAEFALPERLFKHEVAQQIIAARKDLDADKPFRPLSQQLLEIASRPQGFNHDTSVFLNLSSASARLRYTDDPEQREATRESVRDQLWQTALRIEDGGLPAAEQALRTAQRALQQALAEDAPAEEIERLVEQLRQAMQRFLQELADRAQPMPPGAMPQQGQQQMLTDRDLQRMLDRIEQIAQAGARDQAQQMLSQLQQMLESLQKPRISEHQARQAAEMMRQLDQLDDLARRQQELLDETFRHQQQQSKSPNGPPRPQGTPRFGDLPQQGAPMNDLAERQEQLRRDLGETMRQMGESFGSIPRQVQNAEQAMRDAEGQLGQGDAPGAVASETEALEQLRGAGQAMADQLSQQMGLGQQPGDQPGQGMGRGPGQPGLGRQWRGQERQQGQRDPFGRTGSNGQSSTEGARVPDEFDVERARRIRDELYRRSGDPTRPPVEQDYLRRLLNRF